MKSECNLYRQICHVRTDMRRYPSVHANIAELQNIKKGEEKKAEGEGKMETSDKNQQTSNSSGFRTK